ncbi:hypothetical protein HID58_014046 [Brassica napus]|uniref:Uncharacterized protein n=1 Tax=Brassica napus TaxID=3708 RepID=A0ABQ8DG02_BRANA|nr:hypothetical protein HID58_014046 [Brassica napus]
MWMWTRAWHWRKQRASRKFQRLRYIKRERK